MSRSMSRTALAGTFAVFCIVLSMVMPPHAMGRSDDDEAGLKVYKVANCMGCHKWHGMGGGGYGGRAMSLRATELDPDTITLVVRCGIPGSGMPYHGRQSFQLDDDTGCYGQTRAAFGDHLPPLAAKLLSDRQIDVVVQYVLNHVKGRGEPTYDECEAFWGKGKRQCDEYR